MLSAVLGNAAACFSWAFAKCRRFSALKLLQRCLSISSTCALNQAYPLKKMLSYLELTT